MPKMHSDDHDQVVKNTEDIANLQEWQKRQNGSLQRVEDRVEKMYYQLYAILVAALVILGNQVFHFLP